MENPFKKKLRKIFPQFSSPAKSRFLDFFNFLYYQENQQNQNFQNIIQINSKEVLLGGGNIHCITMQIPYCERFMKKNEN